MDTQAWRDQVYQEAFEATCADLQRRRRAEPAFTRRKLEGLLETLYVRQGNDWAGQGVLRSLRLSATIAAHEHVRAEWRKEHRGD